MYEAEETLEELMARLGAQGMGDTVTSWLDGDPANAFFEFKLAPWDQVPSPFFDRAEPFETHPYPSPSPTPTPSHSPSPSPAPSPVPSPSPAPSLPPQPGSDPLKGTPAWKHTSHQGPAATTTSSRWAR